MILLLSLLRIVRQVFSSKDSRFSQYRNGSLVCLTAAADTHWYVLIFGCGWLHNVYPAQDGTYFVLIFLSVSSHISEEK